MLDWGKWSDTLDRFLAGFHSNADASHKNIELDFRGITGIASFAFGTLLLARVWYRASPAGNLNAGRQFQARTTLRPNILCSCSMSGADMEPAGKKLQVCRGNL